MGSQMVCSEAWRGLFWVRRWFAPKLGGGVIKNNGNLPDKLFVEEQMKKFGNESQAKVYVKWENRDLAHVFVAENINGHILFHDLQSRRKEVSYYFSFAKKGETFCLQN